ncbi:hypothetical protein COV05_04655 [Candidatus Uhrbacteria bacterium CG10_big_fil_rev_8_21_14_0_10_48_16]|uniref:HAD family phosphatase n=1 Tax=Candidatus Uhrbacteria bacterium CG10_big_fil_rev_8_21_14_0_10_48_16 TaxID=1975038 RepID=A0A2M8LGA2_9BACT|nr:MAG: hypothetical protein COV05_04655 [Candidatus Uhrbacteria bacterium CG10_big_fil_rev_8_21_14_0_10_48_16]
MKKIEKANAGFLFDMDGLLINSETIAHHVFQDLCSLNGGNFTNEIHSEILGTESEYWSLYVVQECKLSLSSEEFQKEFQIQFEKRLRSEIALMPGALELINWVEEKRYKKCLVTSSGLDMTLKNLGSLDLLNVFNHRVTAEISPKGKPEPDPYLMGASFLDCAPSDCIVFEDSSSGTISGKRANCTVIAVPTVFANRSGFSDADYILDSLEEVIPVLEGLGL